MIGCTLCGKKRKDLLFSCAGDADSFLVEPKYAVCGECRTLLRLSRFTNIVAPTRRDRFA